jgi:hypothetical protein
MKRVITVIRAFSGHEEEGCKGFMVNKAFAWAILSLNLRQSKRDPSLL